VAREQGLLHVGGLRAEEAGEGIDEAVDARGAALVAAPGEDDDGGIGRGEVPEEGAHEGGLAHAGGPVHDADDGAGARAAVRGVELGKVGGAPDEGGGLRVGEGMRV
jgi:hypothetical protein